MLDPQMAPPPRPPVRRAAEEDLDRLVQLFAGVAAEGRWIATEIPFDRKEVRARWSALLSTGEGVLLMTESEGEPTGLAAVVGGRGTVELGMLVAAPFRGQGVGTALLAACLAWARAQGAKRVTLHVFPHNRTALALYRKFGFAEERLLQGHYPRRNGERWDALAMSLAL